MKILKSWLNDWIDIETISTDDISEALESLGFEIESRICLLYTSDAADDC